MGSPDTGRGIRLRLLRAASGRAHADRIPPVLWSVPSLNPKSDADVSYHHRQAATVHRRDTGRLSLPASLLSNGCGQSRTSALVRSEKKRHYKNDINTSDRGTPPRTPHDRPGHQPHCALPSSWASVGRGPHRPTKPLRAVSYTGPTRRSRSTSRRPEPTHPNQPRHASSGWGATPLDLSVGQVVD
jgi:hypothetical protein